MPTKKKPSEFEIEDGILMRYFGNGGAVEIPEGVTDIFFQVFSGNQAITELTLPGSISSVTALVFEGCTSLYRVTLSDGVEAIDFGAFRGCDSLTQVILPATLGRIDKMVFDGCYSLKEIYFCGSAREWDSLEKREGWDNETGDYAVFFAT